MSLHRAFEDRLAELGLVMDYASWPALGMSDHSWGCGDGRSNRQGGGSAWYDSTLSDHSWGRGDGRSNRQGGGSAWYDSTLSPVGGYSVGDGFLLRMGHGVELSEGDGRSGFGVGYGDGDATERRA